MRRKSLGMLLAAFALFVSSVVNADDEKIANHLYQKLSEAKKTGALKNFSLDMEVKKGVVFFTGRVASRAHKTMVLGLAQKAQGLGVKEIRDGITVESATKIKAVPTHRARPVSNQTPVRDVDYVSNQPVAPTGYPPMARGAEMPLSTTGQAPMSAPTYVPAGAANGARYDSPGLPNYAWPSYAPHPNYGAVTYPKTYSPSAWPYIGPFYPYPQVPLGWRKVTLEWDDGWWYLDFNDGKQTRRRR